MNIYFKLLNEGEVPRLALGNVVTVEDGKVRSAYEHRPVYAYAHERWYIDGGVPAKHRDGLLNAAVRWLGHPRLPSRPKKIQEELWADLQRLGTPFGVVFVRSYTVVPREGDAESVCWALAAGLLGMDQDPSPLLEV